MAVLEVSTEQILELI
jgi:hypothetical protein